MSGISRSRLAVLIVLGLFSGALIGAWHQHAFVAERSLPTASTTLMCSLCGVLDEPATEPEPLTPSRPALSASRIRSERPQPPPRETALEPRGPRAPPATSEA